MEDFKYEGLCALALTRRLHTSRAFLCVDCKQENVDTTLGFTFGADAHIHLPENTTHKAWMHAVEITCE